MFSFIKNFKMHPQDADSSLLRSPFWVLMGIWCRMRRFRDPCISWIGVLNAIQTISTNAWIVILITHSRILLFLSADLWPERPYTGKSSGCFWSSFTDHHTFITWVICSCWIFHKFVISNMCVKQKCCLQYVFNILLSPQTHWGLVTHICIIELTIFGSDNGLLPVWDQAIIWTNAGILLIGPLGTNFSEILIEILTVSFKKMCLRGSSAKRQPFCLNFNVLMH